MADTIQRNMTREHQFHDYATKEGMRIIVPPSDKFRMDSVPALVNPFIQNEVQKFPLGTELHYFERKFRYCKAGAVALAVGKLMQAAVPLAGHIDEAISEPAAEATTISFTPAVVTTDDLAADALADGYLNITDETGEGYLYRIKSHPALTGGVAGVLTLYDPIIVQPAAAATATAHHNPFGRVLLHPSPPTAMVVGVTVCAVAASTWFWAQYSGPCSVLCQGTLVIADLCVPSATVDGAVMPSAALETDGPMVGHVMDIGADGEYATIWLALP